jgi:hypothetical protein
MVLVQGWRRSRALSRRTLTDKQWERIEGHLCGRAGTRGRSGVDNWPFVDAVLWMAGNAARWRDLPEVFGKWSGVYARVRRIALRCEKILPAFMSFVHLACVMI